VAAPAESSDAQVDRSVPVEWLTMSAPAFILSVCAPVAIRPATPKPKRLANGVPHITLTEPLTPSREAASLLSTSLAVRRGLLTSCWHSGASNSRGRFRITPETAS